MNVKLLEMTPNAVDLIYAACRQCYSNTYVGDLYETEYKTINIDDKKKLIKHVINSGHHSVLEHVSFTFAINSASRNATHQLVRSRIASYSQQSLRYCTLNKIIFQKADSIKKNKLASEKFDEIANMSKKIYNDLINIGIPSEDARDVLLLSTTSDIVVTMNVRELIHFFEQRCCTCTQHELRHIANKMLKICKDKLGVVFEDIGPKCYSLGYCPENKKRSCGKKPLKNDVISLINKYLDKK